MYFIWRQRWSFGKVLYILARYGCFLDAVLALLCLSPRVQMPNFRILIKCDSTLDSFSLSLSPEVCLPLFGMRIVLLTLREFSRVKPYFRLQNVSHEQL